MEGVILFADDEVFAKSSFENELFNEFNKKEDYPVIPTDQIDKLEKIISSSSTCRALILDWSFKRGDTELEGVQLPVENPFSFLKKAKIFTLIYIYSQDDINPEIKEELEELYPNKIKFNKKAKSEEAGAECERILEDIKKYEKENKHLNVPNAWSQAINISVQSIFKELEEADANWVREIFETAKTDGSVPEIEVTNIFLNLLKEYLIQQDSFSKALLTYIKSEITGDDTEENNKKNTGKLYQRIFYTKLTENAPLRTGDVFRFDDDRYGILITPDCDIKQKKEVALEFLFFKPDNHDKLIKGEWEHFKRGDVASIIKMGKNNKKRKALEKQYDHFNNNMIRYHFLPSFPFEEEINNMTAVIDFKIALWVRSKKDFDNKRTQYKLNAPYVHQIRQRFLSYIGRVGVPAIPQDLRFYNLQEIDSPEEQEL